MKPRATAAVGLVVVAGLVAGSSVASAQPKLSRQSRTTTLSRQSRTTTPSRQSRTSEVAVGGGNIFLRGSRSTSNVGGTCSVSFAVRRKDNALAALTAGHCAAVLAGGPSYDVFQTAASTAGHTKPGDQLGVVSRRSVHVGADGDNALLALGPSATARPAVFTGGVRTGATRAVTGRRRPRVGLSRLCYSGARTGEHCGFTVRFGPRTMTFDENGHAYRIHHEWAALGACNAKPGDSGAPIFLRSGKHAVRAVGILSGGGTVNGHCAVFFTPVALALSSLHVTLLTR